jgi:hypothetical protein
LEEPLFGIGKNAHARRGKKGNLNDTREDGGEQLLGLVTEQQEKRARWRLLEGS